MPSIALSMGSDAGLGGLTPGWKIRPREVPTAWVVRSGYAPRTTLHARPAADRSLHRRVLWKWSILYRLRVSRWAHTRAIEPPRQGDRAFRPTCVAEPIRAFVALAPTQVGRREGNACAILRSSHSTCSGRAPLGLERFLGFPILRTLVIRPRDTRARSTLARGSRSCRWRPRTPHVRMQAMPRATSAWHKLNPFTRISPTLEFLSPSPHESDSVTTRGNGRMERARHGAEGIFRC